MDSVQLVTCIWTTCKMCRRDRWVEAEKCVHKSYGNDSKKGAEGKPPAGTGTPPYATVIRYPDSNEPWPPPNAGGRLSSRKYPTLAMSTNGLPTCDTWWTRRHTARFVPIANLSCTRGRSAWLPVSFSANNKTVRRPRRHGSVAGSISSSRFHTSGRNWSSSSAGDRPILARTLVRYRCGSRPCRSALAISDQSRA